MFCPRCGTENKEGTRFCRQCGLSTGPISEYVSTGGTAPLSLPPNNKLSEPVEVKGIPYKQRMVLAIIFFAMSPAIFAVLGDALGLHFFQNEMPAISAVTMPIWITWAVYHYKAKQRQLENQMAQQILQERAQQNTPQMPPPRQGYLHVVHTQELPNHRDNPVPYSVTEDETIKLPEQKRK